MTARLPGLLAPAVLTLALAVATPTADSPVPTPESTLGFAPCADFKLATSERISDYLHALDASSERISVFDIGRTTEGRRQELVAISSERNLRQLARFKAIARSLALNRNAAGAPLTDRQAKLLAREGKAMVWLNFGLHSTEVAHTQTAPWFVWTMATGESPEIREIRENAILLVLPDANPDGTTMVAEWYTQHAGTPWEMRLPALYHRYAGHDNNRDWYMFTQMESRNVARQLYEEYFPQIVYDQHQTAPFPARIFVPPFADPSNVNIPALVHRGIDEVGRAISQRLWHEGKAGAVSRLEFDTSWNGGMRTAPYFHNMVGVLTETAHASPTPADYFPSTFPRYFANGRSTLEASADYPLPYRGGHWTLRQSCEYMLSASIAVANVAATRYESWQYNMYRMARDAMREGARETYIVPAHQWDQGVAAEMINTLRRGGVEVERAHAPFTAGGRVYETGSYIIRGAQPFLPYIRDLLNPQRGAAPHSLDETEIPRPYDSSGWTLNLQMGVAVDKVLGPVTVSAERVTEVTPAGGVDGPGTALFALDARANQAFRAINRLLAAGATVFRTTAPAKIADASWPAGTFLVPQDPISRALMPGLAHSLGLSIAATDDAVPSRHVRLTRPRIGLYSAWGGNTDEGWTRWLLDQFEFPHATLRDRMVRAGNLRRDYDVILLPDATYREMVSGIGEGELPDQYTGGMTERGVRNLREFVIDGGILICQDRATELPVKAFGLPVADTTADLARSDFRVPGALVRLALDAEHPLGWGMPPEVAAFVSDGPAFSILDPVSARAVAVYPERDVLVSGWLLGESYLWNRTAVIDVTFGRGRVSLLGFRAQHRGQSHGTFKLLFNAIYLPSGDHGE
jgi:hypothetical protein